MKGDLLGLVNIRNLLNNQKVDAILVSDEVNIRYLTGYSNFSAGEREAYLVITNSDQFIITDPRYSESVKKLVPGFKLLERSPSNSTQMIFDKLIKKYRINLLGIEENDLNVLEHKALRKSFKRLKYVDLSNLRIFKTAEEIKKIERACQIGDQAFEFILSQINTQLTELELADAIEDFIRSKGGRLSFETIVAYGKNAAVAHHATSKNKLLKKGGQFILFDFGVKFEQYCSDMSRTVFFGSPTLKQRQVYKVVLDSQQMAVEYIQKHLKTRPEEPLYVARVDEVARDYIVSQGFPVIPHALGHGIGLEVHENPVLSYRSKQVLVNGNVFSIEPGIYISGFGGVRIEDLYAIWEGELVELTKASKELTIM